MRLATPTAGDKRLYDPAVFATASALPNSRLKVDRENLDVLVLYPTISSIQELGKRIYNWDGRGSLAPSAQTIQRAMTFAHSFYQNTSALADVIGKAWISPHISSSEDGEIVFEWWAGDNKLTIYISEDAAEFLKVWGTDISEEMTDGTIAGGQFQGLWLWLNA